MGILRLNERKNKTINQETKRKKNTRFVDLHVNALG